MSPDTPLKECVTLKKSQEDALKRLNIHTAQDLLLHLPSRYTTIADIKFVKDLSKDDHAVLYGKLTQLDTKKTYRKKMSMSEATFTDDTGDISVVWFNQPYIAKMLKDGVFVKLEGNIQERNKRLYISNPEFEIVPKIPEKVGNSLWGTSGEEWSLPVYPESRGISSKWIYHTIRKLLQNGLHETITDPLPEDILNTYSLPSLSTALVWIHTPQKLADAHVARKRFAFEEIFFLQLHKQKDRYNVSQSPTHTITISDTSWKEILGSFPFPLTSSQQKCLDSLREDIRKPPAMSRLLEGDVGSGKTAVALALSRAVSESGFQIAYMAPTGVLAQQIYTSFCDYFKGHNVTIGFLSSKQTQIYEAGREYELTSNHGEVLKRLKNGSISILIGTHALIQKKVQFKHVALAIIDEQHRFGINQRKKLVDQDGSIPHLLSMSATPIPRTLALTMYGDLDLSVLDELPPGRQYPDTQLVPPSAREEVYDHIQKQIENGRQLYVICPRINEPNPNQENALYMKSVKAEAERLKNKVFPKFSIEMLHGKMHPEEKNKIMKKFALGEIDILVATSVIEVGVNVPNATEIIIEGAERFGLSQLHQLRGRVMRGTHQPHCYLFTDSESEKTLERLSALQKSESGFDLAEYDLQERGPGHLNGVKQSGLSDIAMEALKNIKMVEAAREEARTTIQNDPTLAKHLTLKNELIRRNLIIHFE